MIMFVTYILVLTFELVFMFRKLSKILNSRINWRNEARMFCRRIIYTKNVGIGYNNMLSVLNKLLKNHVIYVIRLTCNPIYLVYI